MEIQNPTITAQKLNNVNWKFTINYTARFAPHEIGVRFQDAVRIWEWDTSDHEALTPYKDHQNFTPRRSSVRRTKTIVVDSGTLDTELGAEEIRAQIWLGNPPVPPGVRIEVFTPIIGISP
ncbi:hypothetical protein [Neobacillus sp. LXY-4]|uniref:hypothetical protein n=1 Tax=Neobacillus sp. LXY-4 TaxID=3379826 RepID=UPI003EE30B87